MVNLDGNFNNQDNTVGQNLINIILKDAFRDTDLKQIGKTPRFFDVSNAMDLTQQNLRIMSGFKASVNQTHLGPTLVMDSIFKFMSTTSCLQRINEIRQYCNNNSDMWMNKARSEFQFASIIVNTFHTS